MSSEDVMGAAGGRGIDVAARYADIRRIVSAWFREPSTIAWLRGAHRAGKAGRRIELDDLVQDVVMLLLRRRGTASEYDPARGSLSKYIRTTAWTVVSHGTDRQDFEAPLDDPARWGNLGAIEDTFSEHVRHYVSQNENALASLAREIEADARTGQQRLFDVTVEIPALARVG